METRETITLDARAQHRLYVLNHVLTGGLATDEAARVLHLSVRQVRRLLRRYRADGSAGLVHGKRARVPAPPLPRGRRERVPRGGQLLQVDGSRHRWFGHDFGFATLVAGIDDATGVVTGATFRAPEDAVGYFTTLAQPAERHALP